MSEYVWFRQWASDKAVQLSAHPAAEREVLRNMQVLNHDLIEVAEAIKDLGSGNILTIWKRAAHWLHLIPDPLLQVRHQMRRIRERHGGLDQVRGPAEL